MKARKAIVLAAGLGTRLRPLTCALPKPLLPVWGVPMLTRVVDVLRRWGVEEIAVNCHYLADQVEEWARGYFAANGISVKTSREETILGTGGALNPLRDWIGGEDFYLVNGDIVFEGVDGCPFVPFAEGDETIAQCLVTEEGPRTIEVEPESRFVTNWKSDDAGWSGTFTYCGIALLKPEVLKYVEPTGFSSIVQAYERAMQDGLFVKAVSPKELAWTDAGTIAAYVEVNRDGGDNAFADIPQVAAAAKAAGLDDGEVEFLGARGSDRAFFRAGGAVVVLYDDEKRGENAKYASHAKWLAERGVPVPKVLADLPEIKTLALEWAGAERKMSVDEYARVVEALAKFNALDAGGLDLEPPFDASLWKWERELFAEHCLGTRYAMACPAAAWSELEAVADRLLHEPTALVHRDFQSTNVLWKGTEFRIIDFQGMRLGPAAYDLASLLYDPYVEISEKAREALSALYWKAAGRPDGAEVLPFAAVQRLVQCLGAYGRLASVGQPQFGKFVLPALERLLVAADEAGLDAVGALAEDLIAKERGMRVDHGHEHGSGCKCGCGGEGA